MIAFLHQFTRLFDNTFVPIYLQTDFGYQLACKNEIANWVQRIDIAFYYTTYFTFRILFVLVIPCVALITLNCLLFGALRRAENRRTELLRTKFKVVGGNCSAGAMAKPSGYAISNSDRRAITEPASDLLMALARRPSVGCVKAYQGSRRGRVDKTRKFSIISVNMRCLPKLDRDSSTEHSIFAKTVKTGQSFKKNRPAKEDTRSGFMSEDPSQLDRTSCGVHEGRQSISNEGINANQGKIIRDARLSREDSNDNCSMALQAEVACCSADAHPRQQEEESSPDEERQLEINQHGSGGDAEEEENQSNKEEDSDACFECATCKHSEQLACQACSTVSTEGATCGGQAEATSDPHQQAFSRCSSLIGGTNEDISSCVNTTQNLSSTLFVAQDGTMEEIEIASMRGDDADIEQENLSLQNNDSRLKGDDEEGNVDTSKRDKLAKSGSMDSRLTCGCLHHVKPQLAANLKLPPGSRRDCMECYRSEKCRNSPRRLLSKKLKAKHPKCLQSSSSDQSLDCKEEEIVNEEASQE